MIAANDAIPAEQIEDLRRRLLSAVRRHCPAHLAGHVEDIAQEALIKIVGIIQRSGETERRLPSSYLNRAAYHAIVDALRCRRYQGDTEVPMGESAELAMDPKIDASPERNAVASAIRLAIQQCLKGIVAARRTTVVLHLQGHSVPEIGALLGFSQTKTTNLVYRGLKNLRQCLEKKGVSP